MKKLSLILVFLTTFGFAQTEGTIISGNSKLHYKTFGKGKPILIINGGPGMDCEGFDYLAKEIAKKNFQTIIYDQRGTGKSIVKTPNNQTITMDLMAEDIENLRKHLKIEKWVILGHSFGGIMATFYATKHPETIEKIIFSSSGGVNLKFMNYVSGRIRANLTPEERDSLAFYQRKRDLGDTSENTNGRRTYFLSKAYVYDKSKLASISQRMTQTNLTINILVLQNLQRIRFDCANSFADFKQPVLILQGKNDIISIETAQEIATAFPNSKLVLMDHCAHYGWLDAKDIYFNSIQKFLTLEP
ncbi:alpha/beta fold hydrolase [Flavobacterium terrisoli]|uniref:alpha/beta fold hydrolase n=1 Tax=Flavobacterium terrisoli TaxID=3242195 RepID=UPI00254360EF|nr:alpha/beta fold hydrolase [Flavobacterium buctense]